MLLSASWGGSEPKEGGREPGERSRSPKGVQWDRGCCRADGVLLSGLYFPLEFSREINLFVHLQKILQHASQAEPATWQKEQGRPEQHTASVLFKAFALV